MTSMAKIPGGEPSLDRLRFHGLTASHPSQRIDRCLLLLERSNGIKIRPREQCPNERLPGSRLCAHHLAEEVAAFRKMTGADDQ